MPIYSYFFDSVNNDRPYSGADFARAFGVITEDGVVAADTDDSLGFDLTAATRTVSPGKAVVQGHFIDSTENFVLPTLTGSYAGMIVIRVNITDTRTTTIEVRTDQIPQKDAAIYELPLYNITVSNGTITASTDLRVQGGAIAKPASNVPTYFYRDNGVYLQIGTYSIALTPAQPPGSAKRVWIQIDN